MINLAGGWTVDDSGRLVRPDDSVCEPDDPISAAEVWQCLRIPIKTTLWFNKKGFVPAQSVVDEALRRQPGPRGRPTLDLEHRISIHVTDDQYRWLKNQPGKMSEVVRGLIEKAQKRSK
jgi:hypothetical protein